MSKIVRLEKNFEFSPLPAKGFKLPPPISRREISVLFVDISVRPVAVLRHLHFREVYLQPSSPHGVLGSYRVFFGLRLCVTKA